MGIVYPSDEIARRWDGALRARLRRAPLETFLRARSLAAAPAGVAQDSDDLARATVSIVEAGLSLYLSERIEGLGYQQRATVGHVACLVSRALAELIFQPDAWRIAGLVGTARLLSPWIGLNAAAAASASSARQFQTRLTTSSFSGLDARISESARAAVSRDSIETTAEASVNIAARLSIAEFLCSPCAAEALRELHSGS